MSASVMPGTAISWKWIGRKNSPMMCRLDVGSRWWMSATRPASELSIGIMPISASPLAIAAKQSSNVRQGIGVSPGRASRQARWEFEPGSP